MGILFFGLERGKLRLTACPDLQGIETADLRDADLRRADLEFDGLPRFTGD